MAILIDLSNSEIVLKDLKAHCHAHHVAQIRFWQFRPNETKGESAFQAPFEPPRLLKLLNYLETEKIPHELSPICQSIVKGLRDHIVEVEDIKRKASEFKEGKYTSTDFDRFCAALKSCTTRSLKDHQERAAFHLALVGNGANFSVPGSGKTAVVLAVYEMLRHEEKVNLLLVVGPPSCFSPWRKEFELTLGRKPNYRLLVGGNKTERKSSYYAPTDQLPELCLTTYQTLLNDQEELSFMLQQESINTLLVIDEAHYIKQLQGNWATAVLQLAGLSKYRCVLTGTPMPRSYMDLFNLFDFLWLADSPLNTDVKVSVQIEEKRGNVEEISRVLKEAVGPLFYRVPKSELGLSEPIFHPPQLIQMHQHERRLYDAISNKIRAYATQDYLMNIDLVLRLQRGRMMRLRQCVSYAGLLRTALESYEEDLMGGNSELAVLISEYDEHETPAKFVALRQLARDLSTQRLKVVIWSNFIGTIKLIETGLSNAGYRCKSIYGATPIESTSFTEEETREAIIEEFLDLKSGLNMLIANPAACAESISLHKACQHAIYYDLSYNCAQYLQSLDRIHRVGGSETRSSHYHFLQYVDTIDQDIRANLETKTKRMLDLIEGDLNVCSLNMFEDSGDEDAYRRLFLTGR